MLVGLVRSLKSSHKEALKKTLLCEDYSDLTSPISNKIPDNIHYNPYRAFGGQNKIV